MADYSEKDQLWSDSPIEPALFYQAIFHSELAVYVLQVDNDGTATFEDANDTVAGIAGRPVAEIRGRTPLECLPAEIAHCLESNARECVRTGETLTYERSLDLPTGKVAFRTRLMPVARRFGKITHIVGLTRDITSEIDRLENAQHNATLLQRLGIALHSAIYLLNIRNGTVRFLGGNADEELRQWRDKAEAAGGHAAALYFHPGDHDKTEARLRDLAALRDGETREDDYRILMPDGEYRRHSMRETVFSRDPAGAVEFVLGVADDISERERAQEEVQDLSKRMLTLQVDERRRIAEELHDCTGQHLAAIGLALTRARSCQSDPTSLIEAVDYAKQSLREVQRETRVLSYLLHPPEIESQGLSRAIANFATGFAKRAGFELELHISPEANSLNDEVSLNLFRVCQEALTNVYRHSEASKASIVMGSNGASVTLAVTDNGVGFDATSLPLAPPPGVGLAGMRERVSRLGGEISISGGPNGTTLVATVPAAGRGC